MRRSIEQKEDELVMGWDIGIWGELTFPHGGLAAWQKLDVDASRFKWKEPLAPGEPGRPEKVAKVLARYGKRPKRLGGSEHIRVGQSGDTVTFRGFLNEDSFAHAVVVSAVFRTAGEAGGTGTLCLGGLGAALGFKVSVDAKGSKVEKAPELAEHPMVFELAQGSQPAKAKARGAGYSGRERPFLELPPDVAAAREEALLALEKVDEQTLLAATIKAEVFGTPTKFLHQVHKTKAALCAFLEQPVGNVDTLTASDILGAPVHILSFIDAGKAAELAGRVLASRAPDSVRAQAVQALAQSGSDADLELLIKQMRSRLRHQGEATNAASRALMRSQHPKVEERLVALLSGKPKEAEADTLIHILTRRGSRKALPYLEPKLRLGAASAFDAASSILRLSTNDEIMAATGMTREAFFETHAPGGWIKGQTREVVRWAKLALASGRNAPQGKPARHKAR